MSINIKIIFKKDKGFPYEKNLSGEKWVVLEGYYRSGLYRWMTMDGGEGLMVNRRGLL